MAIHLKAARRQWVLSLAAAINTVLILQAPALSADRPLEKINVGFSSISGNMAPLWVTQEKGFFRKHGLDVQAVLIESGTTTAQSLVAGDLTFAQLAGPAVIRSNLRGADAVIIAGVVNTLTFQLYTDKSISRPDQFRGKSVGVTRYGSATDFAMRYALDKYGLDVNKEVAVLQLGNVPALLAALEAGKIQGAMLSAPTSLRAKKLGFPMLADLQMLGLEYQHTSIATTRSLLKSKPELARNFMRAYVEGIHYAKTHREETLAVLTKYLRTDDKEVLDDTYESIIQALVPEKPYPTRKGVQIILRELGAKDAAARAAKPEQFYDSSIVKELDKSGYIDRLYKASPVVKTEPVTPKVAAKVEPTPATPMPKVQTGSPVIANANPRSQAAVSTVISKASAVDTARAKRTTPEQEIQPATKPLAPVAAKSPALASNETTGPREYTVKPGDTLTRLAKRFYDSIYKWEKIYEANKDQVKNPDYIFIGMKLIIPAESS